MPMYSGRHDGENHHKFYREAAADRKALVTTNYRVRIFEVLLPAGLDQTWLGCL